MIKNNILIGNTIGGFNGARLGNQIFQISLLFSIWKKTNVHFFQKNQGEQFWDCFESNIDNTGKTISNKNYGCAYEYYPEVYHEKGTTLYGYFQNILYIEEYRDDLINFLKFKSKHEEYASTIINSIKNKYNLKTTSIHIRRGDYLHSQDILGNLTKTNYYSDSLSCIGHDVCCLIFSDDIAWCKENINFKNCEFIDANPYESLCLMTKTDYNIIANSTFSWWGAFLNKNSKTFIPSAWTGKKDFSSCGRLQNLKLNNWNTIKIQY